MSLKIQSNSFVMNQLERVRKNDDAPSKEHREQGSADSQNDRKKEQKETFDLERLGQALDDFASDPNTQAHGLNASQTGRGPGLRVTLKDGSGAIVRQFTGEEFLRLREAATAPARGRLLDKKL